MRINLFQIIALTILSFSIKTVAQTDGTLNFSYVPTSKTGYSGTKNVLAIWIQTSTGVFVKTKLLNDSYSNTQDHLPTYAVNAGGTASDCLTNTNKTDATTGATLANYTAKSITWDGKDVAGASNGSIVLDGTYRVAVQSTWNHGTTGTTTRYFNFVKGPNADIQTPTDDANFTQIALNWTPNSLANQVFLDKPVAVIYPNPSVGIFKIDFKNEVNNLKVTNILGQEILNLKFDKETVPTTKNIDLSKNENGIYVISISNEKGKSSYEVVLKK